MSDVLKIAMDRRDDLLTEMSEIDGFIRMAERLIRNHRHARAESSADALQVRGADAQPSTISRVKTS